MPATIETLIKAANSRYELDALDILPGGESIVARLAGPQKALEMLAREILTRFGGERIENTLWNDLREFRWAPADGILVKTPITSDQIGDFKSAHISGGGTVAYSAVVPGNGMTIRGDAPLWIGGRSHSAIEDAVKQALDPQYRFPTLDD